MAKKKAAEDALKLSQNQNLNLLQAKKGVLKEQNIQLVDAKQQLGLKSMSKQSEQSAIPDTQSATTSAQVENSVISITNQEETGPVNTD